MLVTKSGKKLIFGITYGCFDLFHIGHLNFLKTAKKLCDVLVVGVYTDDVIVRYKGRRPIIAFEDRAQIVSEFADCVVKSAHREPDNLTDYDFIFIGNELYGKKLKKIDGTFKGDFIHIPRTMGISTTKIIRRCQDEL